MSQTIDDRIVQMQYRGEQFQSGISEAIAQIEAMDKTLADLVRTSLGLNDVGDGLDLSPLAYATNMVGKQFDALSVIAVSALQRITNQAMATGERLIKSLTVDNLAVGWQKYESKTASVQAIMNATGKSMEEIEQLLNRLMWFSDETSYSFADMTQAIGIMTSSGGEIEHVTELVQGLANAVALAGRGNAEFQRAIFNLNQSYSHGALTLMDWRSFQGANVNSKQLTEELIAAGEALGTIKKGEVTLGNFEDTLNKGWANRQVMERAFGNFARYSEIAYEMVQSGMVDTASEAYAALAEEYNDVYLNAAKSAQEAKSFTEAISSAQDAVSTGWMRSYELIFGNYIEAKKLWTDLANTLWDVFASGGEERNAILEAWKDDGGRDSAIQAVVNVYNSLSAAASAVKDAYRDIFPRTTSERLVEITKSVENWTAKAKLSDESLENLRNTAKGLYAAIDILLMPVQAAIRIFGKLINASGPLIDIFLKLTGSIGYFITEIRDALRSIDPFNRVIDVMSTNVNKLFSGFQNAVNKFRNVDTKDVSAGAESVVEALSPMQKVAQVVSNVFDKIIELIGKTGDIFYSVGESLGNLFNKITQGFVEAINTLDFDQVTGLLKTSVYVSVLSSWQNMIKNFGNFWDAMKGLIGGPKNILGELREALVLYQETLQADVIVKIAKAVGILAASVLAMSLIDPERLSQALSGLTILATTLIVSLSAMSKALALSFEAFFGYAAIAVMVTAFSASLALLAGALLLLSQVPMDQMTTGLIALAGAAAIVVIAINELQFVKPQALIGATAAVGLAVALTTLAVAVKILSTLDFNTAATSVGAIGALLAEIALFQQYVSGTGAKSILAVGAILPVLALGINELAVAVKILSTIDTKSLFSGVAALGGILAALAGFTVIVSKGGSAGIISTSVAMIAFGAAMNLFVQALKPLSEMDPSGLFAGILGILAIITGMVASLSLLQIDKGLAAKVLSLVAISLALTTFAKTLQAIASIGLSGLLTSIVALAGGMGVLVVSLNLMKGTQGASLALNLASAALITLGTALLIMSKMDLKGLAIAIGAILAVFVVYAGAAKILQSLTVAMTSLSFSLAALGAGIWGIGTGLASFASGLINLGVAAITLQSQLFDLIGFITSFLGGLLAAIISSGLLSDLAKAIVMFVDELAIPLIDSFVEMIMHIVQTMGVELPKIAKVFLDLLLDIGKLIVDYTPKLVDLFVEFVVKAADALGRSAYTLANAAFQLLIDVMDGLGRAFDERAPELIEAFIELGINLIKGLIKGILSMGSKLGSTMKDVLTKNVTEEAERELDINSPSKVFEELGYQTVEGFILGIEGQAPELNKRGKAVLSSFIDSLGSIKIEASAYGSELVDHLYSGITKRLDAIYAAEEEEEKKKEEEKKRKEEEKKKKEKEAEIRENLRQALLRANAAAKAGDTASDYRGSIAKYQEELRELLAEEEEEEINAEKEELERLKKEFDILREEQANAEYIKKLQELIDEEDKNKTTKNNAKKTAESVGDGVADGVNSSLPTIEEAMRVMTAKFNRTDEATDAGFDMGTGIAAGITASQSVINTAASDAALGALAAARAAVDSHSPSRKFAELGGDMDDGLALGIDGGISTVMERSKNLSERVLDSIRTILANAGDALFSDIDMSPVITPVLNLDEFNRDVLSLGLSDSLGVSTDVMTRTFGQRPVPDQTAPSSNVINNTFEFNQTNNSPKALSRLDIYRQTKNQFSMFKQGVLNSVPTRYSYQQ